MELNIYFVPKYGVIGAAVVTAVCVTMLNLNAFLIVWRTMNILVLPAMPFKSDNGRK